jgi:hypothetical protein
MSRDHLLKEEFKQGLGMGEDLWIEIAHGPTLVDNNIMLSERCVRIPSQGVAFVHNLFYGSIAGVGRGVLNASVEYASPRYTPIHKPHSTDVTGIMTVLHGDVRFYNNVFVQPKVRQGMIDICGGSLEGLMKIAKKPVVNVTGDGEWDDLNLTAGTYPYSGYMKEDEWKQMFDGYCGEGSTVSRDRYYMPLPVWSEGNAYFNGAAACDLEADPLRDCEHRIDVALREDGGRLTVTGDFAKYLKGVKLITSATLGEAFEPEERFENPDGSDIVFDTDIYGNKRPQTPVPGPFA